jgi:fructokinase
MLFGGIEAGGTKFICGIGDPSGKILDHIQIPTTSPQVTISRVIDYFLQKKAQLNWTRVGLASFGPLDLQPDSKMFGYITRTPKPGWSNFDIRGEIAAGIKTEVVLDTDVNAAALAEYKWGIAREKNPVVYLTVGTGIGGGVVVDGKPLHGLVHPEIGHIRIHAVNLMNEFKGVCPFHEDCLEGLASGPALAAKWGIPAYELPPGHPGWQQEAAYLAEGLANIILSLSPEIIILGGGVMKNEFLFPMIRDQVKYQLNNYVQSDEIICVNDRYIVPPGLKEFSGLLGAIALVSG